MRPRGKRRLSAIGDSRATVEAAEFVVAVLNVASVGAEVLDAGDDHNEVALQNFDGNARELSYVHAYREAARAS
jgi:hypothetical protein